MEDCWVGHDILGEIGLNLNASMPHALMEIWPFNGQFSRGEATHVGQS